MLKKIGIYLGSILLVFITASIGTMATLPNIPNWYEGLNKPSLLPPNSIFGPVWSILYLIIAISLGLIISEKTNINKTKAYIWFAIQLLLNTLWSVVFFGLHSPISGVVVIILLIFSIIMNMVEFKKIKEITFWFYIPYLLWVLFATYLTISVAVLN